MNFEGKGIQQYSTTSDNQIESCEEEFIIFPSKWILSLFLQLIKYSGRLESVV